MAIALVQHTSSVTTATVTSITISFGSAPTDGNSLVMALWAGSYNNSVTSITQTGATWTKSVALNNGEGIEIWSATNISGAASSLTINIGVGGLANTAVFISEWSGGATSGFLDKTATNFLNNNGTNDTLDSGTTATTTQNNELWLAVLGVGGVSNTISSSPSNGFTQLDQQVYSAGVFATGAYYKIVSATGAANTTVTTTGTVQNWTAGIATYKAATANTQVPQLMMTGLGA